MANPVLLNLTLFLTVHFCAVHGYAAIHMHITYVLCFSSILPQPCSCIMLLISTMPVLNSISRFDTNMYKQYDSTVTSKTVAMSNLDVVHEAHHKHPWEFHFALLRTNKVQILGYKLILGSCDLAHWLWRYGHFKSVISLQQFCTL